MRTNPESGLFTIPRRLGLGLFRLHIENGIFVALGMAMVAIGGAPLFGRGVAVLAATGALCASVVDLPGQIAIKARMFALAIGGTTVLTLATLLAQGTPWAMLSVVAAMSFVTGLITAYGKRALGLGVAAVLVILFGFDPSGSTSIAAHTAIFAAGGLVYAAFALLSAVLLDDRNRRLLLGEAIRAFGGYVAAKAELYDPKARPRLALQSLIEAHESFVERLQAARDTIFTGERTASRMRWMAALVALLDCFDTILSSDADIETLRQSAHHHLLRRFGALTSDIAADIQELALALVTPGIDPVFNGHDSQLHAIAGEVLRLERAHAGEDEPVELSALRSTANKLAQTIARVKRLTDAVNARADARALLPNIDFGAFILRETMNPKVLTAQLSLSSPVMRYAIRLTLAMSCGYLITLALPDTLHGGWVLLTTMLIMRASYSMTKQRRNDRIVGTVIGCIIAAGLVHVMPLDWLIVPILITIGSAHAFANADYRVTALSASITALLAVHFLAPDIQGLFFARIFDTLIGAGLAWLFSFLLPSWEWRNVGKLVAAVVSADRRYADLALMRSRDDHTYRLMRKRAHDAAANLSATVRRLVDEPQIDRRALVVLNDLLGANYLLASDLASMRVLFRLRAKELDPAVTETSLAMARANVAAVLSAPEATEKPLARLSRRTRGENLGGANAMVSLRRRLVHIERAAERVGALAAKAIAEI
ncbi:MAG: FUSC family protein [Alphaproteobacteria bacterium]|nr:FUSC family protein [Alphaproteobacteria bacterium]